MTHLPYSWCPICVQAGGRQNNRPKQHSKLPIIHLDFGFTKGFDDGNVHPILTAIDIQSGMIMATECGRATHIILQSDREDFLTAPTSAVANRNGNITTRNSTITRRSRARRTEHSLRKSENSRRNQAELQQRHFNETPTRALDSWTQRTQNEQVCSPQQWTRKLLQQMEQRATHTTL